MRKLSLVLFAPLLLVLLSGCPAFILETPWKLSASRDGEHVQLCLSRGWSCSEKKFIGSVVIYLFDPATGTNKAVVWDVEPDTPIEENKVGFITYGVPPQHWHSRVGPIPLKCGNAYAVNHPTNVFGLGCDGTVVVFSATDGSKVFAKFFAEHPQSSAK